MASATDIAQLVVNGAMAGTILAVPAIGLTAILHTWGQQLRFHPHLHCVVTGGGLSLDGQRWVAGRRRYFLPVKVLGKLFRRHRAQEVAHQTIQFVIFDDTRCRLESQ